jgi:Ca-activated chloride channel family protein
MSFHWPELLWLLVVPAALLAWDLFRRRRQAAGPGHPKILRAEAGSDSLQLSTRAAPPPTRSSRPRWWLFLGVALAIVALARPQWGRLEEPVFDQSREILLALDLSRSMLAPDVKPTRLDRAKLLITSLLEKLSGERVGLVVFAGTGFLQSPLSSDYEILREFLPSLTPDFLPQGGSNYSALLKAATEAFSATSAADRFLVVLTDGEATDDSWRDALAELKKKNVRVIGLGVGTATGAMIPDNAGGLIKDERGAVVMSKLESATLDELARATDGVYRNASAWIDLAALVRETVESGRKGKFAETNTVRLVERFQLPLAFAVWCMLVSLCYEFPIHPRPRVIALKKNAEFPMPNAELKTASALFVIACLSLGIRHSAFAAEAATPPPSAALSKIIGRVAGIAAPSARDWADLARETVNWGSRVKSEQQPVPEGPVHDALSAVSLGSKLDAQTTDWPKLREELEALLKKDDEKKDDDQQKQDQQKKNDDQKQQDQKKDKSDQQQNDQSQQHQDDKSEKSDSKNSNPNQTGESQKKEGQDNKDGESAFGDMKKPEPPPQGQPQPGTQKVGGNQDEKKEQAAPIDPSLAIPLQKLEQIRSQDSPARLFQLMEGERKPDQKKPVKDW